MEEENNSTLSGTSAFSPSSPLNLSQQLLTSLDDKQKRLFYKVLRQQFDKILPLRSFNQSEGVITYYWMVEAVRKNLKLRASHLALLTLIYFSTNKGHGSIPLRNLLPFCPVGYGFVKNNIDALYKANYLKSDRFHKGRSKSIYLTYEAIQLMKTIHQELRQMIYQTHVDPGALKNS